MKKSLFIKIAVFAAVLAAIILGAKTETEEIPMIDVGVAHRVMIEGFEDTAYFGISFDERKEFGLIGEDEIGLTEENSYKITEEDIGEFMGTVIEGEGKIVGSKVFHFAKYPDSDKICIIETPEGFEFYTGSIFKQLEAGESSDLIFETFGFPENLEKAEVQYAFDYTAFEITDEAETEQIFEIFSGKENIGDEKAFEIMDNGYTGKGCGVVLTAKNGFELYVNYYPEIEMFWARGYFLLSESETETLNKILKFE